MALSHQENILVNQVKFLRLVAAFVKQFVSHLLKNVWFPAWVEWQNFIAIINNLIGSYNILGIDQEIGPQKAHAGWVQD